MLGLSQVYSGSRVAIMYSSSIYNICTMKPGIDDGLVDIQRWKGQNAICHPQHAQFVTGKRKPFLASTEVPSPKQEVHTATNATENESSKTAQRLRPPCFRVTSRTKAMQGWRGVEGGGIDHRINEQGHCSPTLLLPTPLPPHPCSYAKITYEDKKCFISIQPYIYE
ncbi:hypothetical protein J6590_008034 [Homalodisca vitripennis]|nr:hypothetical protein J6590_008034 [Homalodisca vitripennis]